MMAVLFSVDSLVTAKVSQTVPIFQYAVVSGALKWALSLFVNRLCKVTPLFGRRKDLRVLIPTGFVYGGFLVMLYGSLAFIPLVDAVGLFYLNPALCAIFGRLAFKDPLGPSSIVGLALVLFGVGLINQSSFLDAGKDVTWDLARIVGTVLGFGAALFAALAFSATRGLGDRVSPGVISTWAFQFQTGLALPPMLANYPAPLVVISDAVTICLILLSAVLACAGEIFACRACQRIPVGLATSIEATQLVWGLLWSVLFLEHKATWHQGLGIVLTIGGVFCIGLDGSIKRHLKRVFRRRSIEGSDELFVPETVEGGSCIKHSLTTANT
ncbi:hypothetical protein BSKO_06768 [Bryopsis sp. KO-2023]|nr:hypothetical protein BSKO_06768 [Bryopsis sp. KO-2023]